LEEEVHIKRQPAFQHVLEPVKIKAKQALVNPVGAVVRSMSPVLPWATTNKPKHIIQM